MDQVAEGKLSRRLLTVVCRAGGGARRRRGGEVIYECNGPICQEVGEPVKKGQVVVASPQVVERSAAQNEGRPSGGV